MGVMNSDGRFDCVDRLGLDRLEVMRLLAHDGTVVDNIGLRVKIELNVMLLLLGLRLLDLLLVAVDLGKINERVLIVVAVGLGRSRMRIGDIVTTIVITCEAGVLVVRWDDFSMLISVLRLLDGGIVLR